MFPARQAFLAVATLAIACSPSDGSGLADEPPPVEDTAAELSLFTDEMGSDLPLSVRISSGDAAGDVEVVGIPDQLHVRVATREGLAYQIAGDGKRRAVDLAPDTGAQFDILLEALGEETQLSQLGSDVWIEPTGTRPGPSVVGAAATLLTNVQTLGEEGQFGEEGLTPADAAGTAGAVTTVLDTLRPTVSTSVPAAISQPRPEVTVTSNTVTITFPGASGSPTHLTVAAGEIPDFPETTPLPVDALADQLADAVEGQAAVSADDLAALVEQCKRGDGGMCNILFLLAPIGSDEERLAAACGQEGEEPTEVWCDV